MRKFANLIDVILGLDPDQHFSQAGLFEKVPIVVGQTTALVGPHGGRPGDAGATLDEALGDLSEALLAGSSLDWIAGRVGLPV